MVDKEIILKVFNDTIQKYPSIIDSKCKYESFEYTNSKGEKIILKVREVKRTSTFMNYLKKAYKSQNPRNAWRVEVPSDESADENYMKTRMFVTRHGSTIAIRDNGDIISVCGNEDGVKESNGALLSFAVSKGGDRLDSFDGNYGYYRHMGFEPVSYVEFNEEFAPDGWDKSRDRHEPIIFFKYTGMKSDYLTPQEFYDKVPLTGDYGEAHDIRDRDIIYNTKSKKNNVEVKFMTKVKKEYPLSYDEFEDKVVTLFLQEYGEGREEKILEFINALKDDEDNDYLESLYLDSCYCEDKYGDAFTDTGLVNQPVRLLWMLYGD